MSLSAGLHGATDKRRWTPLELGTTLVAWWDASDSSTITTATGGVSQWDDKSGNGHHATQGTSGNRPAGVTDGIEFTSANTDHLLTDISASTYPRAFAAVINTTSNTNSPQLFGVTGSGGLNVDTDTLKLGTGLAYVVQVAQSSGSIVASTDTVVVAVATSTSMLVSLRGTTTSATHSRTLTANRTVTIGASKGTVYQYGWNGTLREALVFDALTTADRQLVEGYLSWKWGRETTLPSGHPYRNIQP